MAKAAMNKIWGILFTPINMVRPTNMYCPRVAKFCHQGLVQGPWARL